MSDLSFHSPTALRPKAAALLFVLAAVVAAGCSTPNPPQPAPAPQVQPLAEYMTEAAKAHADRMVVKERETYRTAARLYPAAKEPWAKLAESYFESGDYGNAILASQEVLQRDPADPVAASVLAVSGLRVSTQALSALRTQNGNMPADSRTQAENLTRTLRELLGESVLVPPPQAEVQPAQAARKPAAKPVAVKAPQAASAPAAPAQAVAPVANKPAAKPAEKNPFDTLK